ncbi:MAG: outer membrane beta-barrel protein [Chitinophagaceae bacterium]|nr:outer membrane beta-barrel protein [Chitinophagaceae bacterium]
MRLNYSGSTTQPTINQLQPLRSNNDIFNEYSGNLELKPTFTSTFNVSHNGYDFLKDRWMYQSINFNVSSNAITNSRIIDLSTGKTTTTPINTNGNIYLGFWSGIGMKVKKIDTRLNFSPNISYNQFADYLNNVKTVSKTLSAGMNIWASKSKDKKYDLSLSNDFRFNNNRTTQKSSFSTNNLGLNATVYYKKTWSINSDYNYYWREKIREGDESLNNHLWNARLQKTFRNNEFTLYFMVRDILNQNVGINRNFYGYTYNETRNDRLKDTG